MKDGFTGERSIVLPPMTLEAEREDPLVSSLYITDIGYYPHADGHYRQRPEGCKEYVLIYCMGGKGWYETGGCRYEVGGGQYFILPPRVPHAYGADRECPWTIYWLHFTGQHADIYSEGQHLPQDIRPTTNSRISERQHVFEEIFATLERSTDRESLRYASSLLHYYLASMRYLHHYRQETPDHTNVIAAAQRYIQENLERRLTLNDLARYTGYSASRFSQLFRQQTGESPINYFNRKKMEHAAHLLLTTDMRINQICPKVGFEDSCYFSRLFTQLMGCSPKQYRSRNKSCTFNE